MVTTNPPRLSQARDERDVVAGDPGLLRRLAAALSTIAASLDEQGTRLRDARPDGWVGAAREGYDGYRERGMARWLGTSDCAAAVAAQCRRRADDLEASQAQALDAIGIRARALGEDQPDTPLADQDGGGGWSWNARIGELGLAEEKLAHAQAMDAESCARITDAVRVLTQALPRGRLLDDPTAPVPALPGWGRPDARPASDMLTDPEAAAATTDTRTADTMIASTAPVVASAVGPITPTGPVGSAPAEVRPGFMTQAFSGCQPDPGPPPHDRGGGEWRHVVRRGETLSGIAEEMGSGRHWPEVFHDSGDIVEPDGRRLTDPDLIYPGWEVVGHRHSTPGAGGHASDHGGDQGTTPGPDPGAVPDAGPAPGGVTVRPRAVVATMPAPVRVHQARVSRRPRVGYPANLSDRRVCRAPGWHHRPRHHHQVASGRGRVGWTWTRGCSSDWGWLVRSARRW